MYLAIEPMVDENGETVNSTSRVTWSKTNKYEWKKGNVGQKTFFKIQDPVSKKILTAITDEEFELLSNAAIIYPNDDLSLSLSWLDCLLTDSEVFYLICRK